VLGERIETRRDGLVRHATWLLAVAYSGFFLNLFNLIPVVPLDGGRAMAALSPAVWVAGLASLIVLAFLYPSPILIMIVLFGPYESYRRWKSRNLPQNKAYYAIPGRTRALVAVVYLGIGIQSNQARMMRDGGFYPDHKLRLFRRGAARLSEGVGPHSTPQFGGPRGRLHHNMLHYAYPTMGIYLEHMNRYSSEIARLLHKKGRDSQSLPAFLWNAVLNPTAVFIYNYFLRLGFLDGREGLILHINHSVYIHWKFIKAWRLGQGKE